MTAFLIDTNLLLELFNQHESIMRYVRRQKSLYKRLHISVITYYEVYKGWEWLAHSPNSKTRAVARNRLRRFETFCQMNTIVPLNEDACRVAGEIYNNLRKNGFPLKRENDLLIAGSALANGFGVATANVADFQDIEGLIVENWLN